MNETPASTTLIGGGICLAAVTWLTRQGCCDSMALIKATEKESTVFMLERHQSLNSLISKSSQGDSTRILGNTKSATKLIAPPSTSNASKWMQSGRGY